MLETLMLSIISRITESRVARNVEALQPLLRQNNTLLLYINKAECSNICLSGALPD